MLKTNLKVYTSTVSYRGPDRMDISVKSGNPAFAPTWEMVMGTKDGTMSRKEYTKLYYKMMRRSASEFRDEWLKLLAMEEVTLCCYCRAYSFCHRYILKTILVALGATYVKEIKRPEDKLKRRKGKG